MPGSGKLKRELEVAFSKHAQPVWFRLIKYVLIIGAFYFFRGNRYFWPVAAILFVLALCLHFWYRYKTEGWTKSYGLWKYEKNKPKQGW